MSDQATGTNPPETLEDALGNGDELVAEIQEALADEPAAVTPKPLDELVDGPVDHASRDLRLLADIDVEVSVEFGRIHLPLKQLLTLGRGSIIELGRRPDEPVDVLANGTPIARAEVVMVGDDLGLRVTEIVRSRAGDDAIPERLPVVPDPFPAPAAVDGGDAEGADPADTPAG